MMKTKKELKAEYEEKLRKLEKEERLVASLPKIQGVEIPFICQHANCTSIIYGKKYPDRFKIIEAFKIIDEYRNHIIPSAHIVDSCISTIPLEITEEAKVKRGEFEGEYSIQLNLELINKSQREDRISFYSKLGDDVLSVDIKIHAPRDIIPDYRFKTNTTGDIVFEYLNPKEIYDLGANKKLEFWSPPGSYSIRYYWSTMKDFDRAKHKLIK